MLNAKSALDGLHKEALLNVTNILYHRFRNCHDLPKQARVVWCVFIAAIETHDPVHRDWLTYVCRD